MRSRTRIVLKRFMRSRSVPDGAKVSNRKAVLHIEPVFGAGIEKIEKDIPHAERDQRDLDGKHLQLRTRHPPQPWDVL